MRIRKHEIFRTKKNTIKNINKICLGIRDYFLYYRNYYCLNSLSIVGLQDAKLINAELIGIGMGFLPLFAIAIVELAKIPLVQGILLAKSSLAKGSATILLTLLCIMTFETMSTGLEQNIANREHAIKQDRLEVNEIQQEINLIDDKIIVLQELKPEEIRNRRR